MQIIIKATQAVISSVRRDCSLRLYFLIKESDYILSKVRWAVSGDAVCPQWEFWKR